MAETLFKQVLDLLPPGDSVERADVLASIAVMPAQRAEAGAAMKQRVEALQMLLRVAEHDVVRVHTALSQIAELVATHLPLSTLPDAMDWHAAAVLSAWDTFGSTHHRYLQAVLTAAQQLERRRQYDQALDLFAVACERAEAADDASKQRTADQALAMLGRGRCLVMSGQDVVGRRELAKAAALAQEKLGPERQVTQLAASWKVASYSSTAVRVGVRLLPLFILLALGVYAWWEKQLKTP